MGLFVTGAGLGAGLTGFVGAFTTFGAATGVEGL